MPLKAPRQMNLPHAVQRNLVQELKDLLPAVAIVGINVVKIQQNSAIRAVHEFRNELAVGKLDGTRSQVVPSRLDGERNTHGRSQTSDCPGVDIQSCLGLPRRQEESCEEVRREIEREVFAGPGRTQIPHSIAQ